MQNNTNKNTFVFWYATKLHVHVLHVQYTCSSVNQSSVNHVFVEGDAILAMFNARDNEY